MVRSRSPIRYPHRSTKVKYLRLFLFGVIYFALCGISVGESPKEITPALAIADLTDPAKLATLKGERAANPRLQKCVYWLASAEEHGEKPKTVLDESAKMNKTAGSPYAGFVSWGLLENLKIAKELGLLNPKGMSEMRRGKSAMITKGQYAGQEAEADHVIPKAVCPELENQVMNLELLPAKLNRAKSDKVTDRAKGFAKELYDANLLSEEGWGAVRSK